MNRLKRSLVCFVFLFGLVSATVAPCASLSQFALAGSSSDPEPYSWYHGFNFTNSNYTFGPLVMEPEEVEQNMRNYMFQLLYSDIEVACEVSIFDIELLMGFDSWIIKWLGEKGFKYAKFAGFCNGMSAAARDYFLHPGNIPLGRSRAYDLPPPDPDPLISQQTGGDVVESAIKEYVLWKGSQAFFNPNHWLTWLKLYLELPWQLGGTNNAIEYQRMADLMHKGTPFYEPVVLLLVLPAPGKITESHFVLAYDYEEHANGSRTTYVYNCNINRGPGRGGLDWITLSPDFTFEGTGRQPDNNWSVMAAYPPSPDYHSILTDLFNLICSGYSIFAGSPVELHITDPMGRTIGPRPDGALQLDFPALYVKNEESTIAFIPYASTLPYQINVTGTDTGNYMLEVNRVVNGQLVTQSIQRNITAGETDTYNLELKGDGIKLNRQAVFLSDPRDITANSMKLEWSPYTDPDFTRYEIYQSTSWGALGTNVHNITDASTTTYTVTELKPETAYHYTIRVIDTAGGFADSNQVSGITTKKWRFPDWLYAAIMAAVVVIILVAVVLVMRKRRK